MWLAALVLALMPAPSPPPDYKTELDSWRRARQAELTAEDGWLSVTGLYWLAEGDNPCGSRAGSRVLLPKSAPERLGVFVRQGQRVSVRVEPGVAVKTSLNSVTAMDVLSDVTGSPDVLRTGSLSIALIDRGGELGIRVKDSEAPSRKGFKGQSWYPPDTGYRVTARFVPAAPGASLEIANVLGQIQKLPSPGEAVFTLAGHELRLTPVLEAPDAKELFFIFRDETAARETYGAGRFLYTELPKDGSVVLDFNKAENPPCAFTAFATCPLPPKTNRLPVRVEAGEKWNRHD
jgi:uncharacterized protein (DUF1684 family)